MPVLRKYLTNRYEILLAEVVLFAVINATRKCVARALCETNITCDIRDHSPRSTPNKRDRGHVVS